METNQELVDKIRQIVTEELARHREDHHLVAVDLEKHLDLSKLEELLNSTWKDEVARAFNKEGK